MIWRSFLFLWITKWLYVSSHYPTLSPEFNDVLENSSLELTCHTHINTHETTWRNSNSSSNFSTLIISEETGCKSTHFLEDSRYFETNCYKNGSFKVKIKSVKISNHGQEWYCSVGFKSSDKVSINVQVPIKFVRIKNIPKNVITVIENVTTTLSCETSVGRPPAQITWTKLSKEGIRINLTQSSKAQSVRLENGMTKQQSNLTLRPLRGDNNSYIICEATNKISDIKKREVKLNVNYPPDEPYFEFIVKHELAENATFIKNKLDVQEKSYFTVQCICGGAPLPSCLWNTTIDSKSTNLTFTNITKSEKGFYECLAENYIRGFPKYEMQRETSKAKLEINVLYESTVKCFQVLGVDKSGKYFEVTENDTISFACSVDSNPASSITISFKERQLENNISLKYLIHSRRIQSCLDDGVYKCAAYNNLNHQPSLEELMLRVRCTPLLSPEFNMNVNISSAKNSTVTFAFKALAYPVPEFQWLKLSGTPWKTLKSCRKTDIRTVDRFSNLTISDIVEEDFGQYKLMIRNEVGSLEQLYFLNANDNSKLTESSILDWKLMLYGSGGIMFISTLLVMICFISKRTKRQSTTSVIYQNVPSYVQNAENIYQNVSPSCAGKEDTNKSEVAFPAMKTSVQEHQDVMEEQDGASNGGDIVELDEFVEEPVEYCNKVELLEKLETIKVSELFHYFKDRTDESFSDDLKSIPTAFQMPCLFAHRPENISCNRYKGIIPYDHSRVQIENQPDFYINASYIDGYKTPKAYIACLGPTARTHDDFKSFWSMVWYEKVEIIVMVTKLNEISGMKCEQYWPDVDLEESYGDILVSSENVQTFADYTLRTFEVINNADKDEVCRRLVHLHFTAWPDKKVPGDVRSLLEFRHRYRDIKTTLYGPVIVHCSAGIGRTGVFIAIDKLIMEGEGEGAVNVPACVKEMREQRMKMVQTSEQYKFIFKALVHALHFDSEPLSAANLEEQIEDADGYFYNRQHKELEISLERSEIYSMSSEVDYENVWGKCKHGADIADNPHRVRLYLNRELDDTDFINAIYVNSYKRRDNFILATSPNPGSESDFLTMIFQENCHFVVSMDDIEQGTMTDTYLPAERDTLQIGTYTVSCSVYDSKPQYIVRKVTIKSKEEFSNGERDFYHFQYKKWTAASDVPESAEELVEFVKDVENYATLDKIISSHVLVHCLDGSKRSGIFCAVAVMMEKLLHNRKISVLNTLRQIGIRRPHAITSVDQVMFCYQAALAIVHMHKKLCIRYDRLL